MAVIEEVCSRCLEDCPEGTGIECFHCSDGLYCGVACRRADYERHRLTCRGLASRGEAWSCRPEVPPTADLYGRSEEDLLAAAQQDAGLIERLRLGLEASTLGYANGDGAGIGAAAGGADPEDQLMKEIKEMFKPRPAPSIDTGLREALFQACNATAAAPAAAGTYTTSMATPARPTEPTSTADNVRALCNPGAALQPPSTTTGTAGVNAQLYSQLRELCGATPPAAAAAPQNRYGEQPTVKVANPASSHVGDEDLLKKVKQFCAPASPETSGGDDGLLSKLKEFCAPPPEPVPQIDPLLAARVRQMCGHAESSSSVDSGVWSQVQQLCSGGAAISTSSTTTTAATAFSPNDKLLHQIRALSSPEGRPPVGKPAIDVDLTSKVKEMCNNGKAAVAVDQDVSQRIKQLNSQSAMLADGEPRGVDHQLDEEVKRLCAVGQSTSSSSSAAADPSVAAVMRHLRGEQAADRPAGGAAPSVEDDGLQEEIKRLCRGDAASSAAPSAADAQLLSQIRGLANQAPACENCGAQPEKPLQCSVCKVVKYCNSECQKADWKFHKRRCKKPEPQVAELPAALSQL
eukprot:TRINITY_DN38782_c0_g1_i2.p1 TRINITY_DN38782_c0_g1~~TRINITY_DN38782_c0_g1_i2.p1  ORF type:complete len:591 (-),score=136.80 TRINITY_DN38782_c0_g1_i2:463-2187(-)